MKIHAVLKGAKVSWTGASTVDMVITLEKVPISQLGLLWDLPQGPITVELHELQASLPGMREPEDVRVPEAFR